MNVNQSISLLLLSEFHVKTLIFDKHRKLEFLVVLRESFHENLERQNDLI